jgi:hypothetical protein
MTTTTRTCRPDLVLHGHHESMHVSTVRTTTRSFIALTIVLRGCIFSCSGDRESDMDVLSLLPALSLSLSVLVSVHCAASLSDAEFAKVQAQTSRFTGNNQGREHACS